MADNNKDFVCTRIKLLMYLIKAGFDFTNIRQDRDNPERVVFIFRNSPELRKKIDEYYSMREQG